MLDLAWSEEAEADLEQILDYIAYDNPSAAVRLKAEIDRFIQAAVEFPDTFRVGRAPGTREIVAHPNYIVVYRVSETRLEVVAVFHARRQYP